MSDIVRWDIDRQRAALVALIEPGFLTTAEGAGLIEQLEHVIAPSLVSKAFSWGYPMGRDEIRQMILERLLREGGAFADRVALTVQPWNYLTTCAFGWLDAEKGHRAGSLENESESLSWLDGDEGPLTPLQIVIDQAVAILAPRTPERARRHLMRLVSWLAYNPPQKLSYEHVDLRWANREVDALTMAEVKAVANVCWGGRPRQSETSILGPLLLDASWRPTESPTHTRALRLYQSRMLAAAGTLPEGISA